MSNLEHGEINMAVQECEGCLSCDIALESSFTAPRIITLIPPRKAGMYLSWLSFPARILYQLFFTSNLSSPPTTNIMKPHMAVGIATVVFYAPVTLYAQYIGFRCWKYGSRMACYMVMVFTLSTSGRFSFAYFVQC
jgi:hypothetical protein